jgi:hypothetical protein
VSRNLRAKYFHPQVHEVEPSAHTTNATLKEALWAFSEQLVAEALAK